MWKLNTLLAVTVLLFAAPQESNAQYLKATYRVQVKYVKWTSGISYWSTVEETTDLQEAQWTYDLLEAALDAGVICDIMDCSFGWIITDVRIQTDWQWIIYRTDTYNFSSATFR